MRLSAWRCVVPLGCTIALATWTRAAGARELSRPDVAIDQEAAVPLPSSVAVPAPGVDAVLDAKVKAVSSRLRCPVCQGESIQDSPAELSLQMRTVVREQLASGRSEREVMDYFVQKYGQWILLEPRAEGMNLVVYLLPIAFLVGGGAAIGMAVRKWTKPAGNVA